MLRILKLLAHQHLKDSYPNKWSVIGELAAIVVSLTIYWYTAKAFGANFGGNYFYYITIGHVALAIPFALFAGISIEVRNSAIDGTLEFYLVSPLKPQFMYALSGLVIASHELIRIALTILIAMLLFQFKVSDMNWMWVIFLEICSIPLFLGAGLLGAALLIYFGKGMPLVAHLVTLLSILSGMYFPISVFPPLVQKLSIYLSPFSFLLVTIRKILNGDSSAALASLPWIVGWTLILVPLGYFVFEYAIFELKRKGRPLLLL